MQYTNFYKDADTTKYIRQPAQQESQKWIRSLVGTIILFSLIVVGLVAINNYASQQNNLDAQTQAQNTTQYQSALQDCDNRYVRPLEVEEANPYTATPQLSQAIAQAVAQCDTYAKQYLNQ